MKVIESPTATIGTDWTKILEFTPSVVEPGFESSKEIAAKTSRSVSYIRRYLNKKVKKGLLESKLVRVGPLQSVRYYRPIDYVATNTKSKKRSSNR